MLLCGLSASMTVVRAGIMIGKVTDRSGNPVGFANVVVLALPDSTYVSGTLTDAGGCFVLNGSDRREMTVRISSLGFSDVYMPFSDSPDTCVVELDSASYALGTVTISAHRPVTRLDGDAIVTDVKGTLLSKAGTAADVLEKIPGMYRANDGFRVVGKGTPIFYINGRRVRDLSELERLESRDIRSVEVVGNPGSRYDASVKAVVRITTVPRKGDGFGFNLRSSVTQSENTDLTENLSLNYRHDRLDVFGTVNYNRYAYLQKSDISLSTRTDDLWQQTSLYRTEGKSDNFFGEAGVNFQFDEHHSAGGRFSVFATTSDVYDNTNQSTVTRNEHPYDTWLTQNHTTTDSDPSYSANVYYNGKAGNLDIDFNADWYSSRSSLLVTSDEQSEVMADRLLHSVNDICNRMAAARLVLSLPVGGGSLNFGGEFTHTDRHDNYRMDDTTVVKPSFSHIRENNVSAFGEYSHCVGKFSLTAGLRYEHVWFNYLENDRRIDDQCRTFDNVYPNVSASTAFGELQAQLSYSVKTARPSYTQLRNGVSYINRMLMQTGNPALEPTTTHDVSLTAVWRFLQMSLSWQTEHNTIIYWGTQIPGDNAVTLLDYCNLDRLPVLVFTLAASPKVGCWHPTASFTVRRQWLDLESMGSRLQLNAPIFVTALNNGFSLPAGFTVSLDFRWQSTGYVQNIRMPRPTWLLNVAVTKSFLNDNLSVELRGTDLLRKNGDSNLLYIPLMQLRQYNTYDSRAFMATVRLRFNAVPSKYKGTGAGRSERSRL